MNVDTNIEQWFLNNCNLLVTTKCRSYIFGYMIYYVDALLEKGGFLVLFA